MHQFEAVITAYAIPEVEEKIHKLEKRMKSKINYSFSEKFWRFKCNGKGEYMVKVTAEVPEIEYVKPGYEVVAMVDFRHLINRENGIIRLFNPKFEEQVKQFQQTDRCDHCNKIRRRSVIYVIHHVETGELKVVGRQCIKDYLHITVDPLVLFSYAEDFFKKAEDKYGAYGPRFARDRWFPVWYILGVADYMVSKYGYVSRAKSDDTKIATSTKIFMHVFEADHDKNHETGEVKEYSSEPIPEEFFEKGKEIHKWFREHSSEVFDDSVFAVNLKVLVEQESVTFNHFGMLGYLIVMQDKFLHPEKYLKPAEEKKSGYVGEIKERKEFDLKFVGSNHYVHQFGYSRIYTFEDNTGNIMVWFTPKSFEFEVGKEYKILGTITEHREFKRTKQTIISRCKVLTPVKEND